MNRTLETAEIMMTSNKLKVKKVIVLPELSEVLSKICDLGSCLVQKREKYRSYDFGEMKRFLKENRQIKDEKHWQDVLVDHQHREFISH